MVQERYSRQREAVYNSVVQSHEHPTAELIFEDVRRNIPNISLGTVYRNLKYLVEKGKIREVVLDDNVSRYDGNVADHYHCICTECGEIQDISIEASSLIGDIASKIKHFTITSHKLEFYGVCDKCSN